MDKVLAIMGSARKNKHTDQALDIFLQGLDQASIEYEKVYLIDLNIYGCIDCRACFRTGQCPINDDMALLYDKLDQVNGIVIASPIYFNSVTAQTKAFIDRIQRYYGIKYGYGRDKVEIIPKTGYFISVGGADYTLDQFAYAFPVIDYSFKALNAKYIGNFCLTATDNLALEDRKELIEQLRHLGRNFYNNKEFLIQQ